MRSSVVKRSIVIAGHKTSVSLEDAFWEGLKEIADERKMTLSDLAGSIDTDRRQGNFSSALRLFVLDHYKSKLARALESHPSSQPGYNSGGQKGSDFKSNDHHAGPPNGTLRPTT